MTMFTKRTITPAQFAEIEAVLTANPPTGRGDLAGYDADGTLCRCALGQLAHDCGIPDQALFDLGYNALTASKPFRARFGLHDFNWSTIYIANDSVPRDGLPADRAAKAIRAARTLLEA